jgi:hypothetical protein
MERQSTKSSSRIAKYLVDALAFIGFLLAMDPWTTGIALHEWMSIAFGGTVIVHLLLSWRWIVAVTCRFFSRLPARTRLNYILNLLLFIDGTIIGFSGLLISEEVLPLIGITVPHMPIWRGWHSLTADLALLLLGLHVALHWSWIVTTTKRCIVQPLRPRRSETTTGGVGA